MPDRMRFIAYRTNNESLSIRPCGMNDIVYNGSAPPTSKLLANMLARTKRMDYDFVVLFDNETVYTTYGTR
jgi:hypothetical protein